MRLDRARVEVVRWPLADGGRGGAARGRWQTRTGAVLIVDGDGGRGLGEASPLPGHGADDGAAARAAAELARFASGLPRTLAIDPARPLASLTALLTDVAEPSARFAIETAALDLLARTTGRTLAALLGAGDDRAAAGRAIAVARVIDDADGAAAAWAAGFTTLKLKVGGGAAATVAAVHRAAPAARLRIDVNRGWAGAAVDDELAAVTAAAAGALEYVEEPTEGVGPALRGPRAAPLALDESLADADRDVWLDRALASGALAAVVLKPTVLGGLAACLALAARARAHGVDAVASHTLDGPIAHAAVIALARALGGPRAHGVDIHAGLPGWNGPVADGGGR